MWNQYASYVHRSLTILTFPLSGSGLIILGVRYYFEDWLINNETEK